MPDVLVPLAEGCEELEAVTIIDLLRRAEINVTTASLGSQLQLTGSRQTGLVADCLLDEVIDKPFDMLVLPGGQPGTNNLKADPRIIALVLNYFEQGKWLAAICAAPSILAHAGILEDKTITYYPGTLNESDWPTFYHSQATVVIDTPFITSRGPGTALDFALSLIAQLTDTATHDAVKEALLLEP